MSTQPVPINYTYPSMSDQAFESGIYGFHPNFMDGFYNASRDMINGIFPYFDENSGFHLNPDDLINFDDLDVDKFLWDDNKTPIVFMIASTVLALLVTIVGILWCCKRCCCRDRACFCEKPYDPQVRPKKTKSWKKHTAAAFVLLLAIFYAYGITAVFVTNQDAKKGSKDFSNQVDAGLNDVRHYMSITKEQINTLLIDNYQVLRHVLETTIVQSNKKLEQNELLAEWTIENESRHEFARKIKILEKLLKNIKGNLNHFKLNKIQLNDDLIRIEHEISKIFENCYTAFCTNLKDGEIDVELEKVGNVFTDIENLLDNLVKNFNDLNNIKLKSQLEKDWRNQFDALKFEMRAMMEPMDLGAEIIGTEIYLKDIAKNLTDAIDEVPIDDVQEDMHDVDDGIDVAALVCWLCMIAASGVLIIIFLVMNIGFVFAIYGEEPGLYSEDSPKKIFSKTFASPLLNCGILLMFIFFFFFSMVALAAFTLSGVGREVVCESIYELSVDTNRSNNINALSPVQTIMMGSSLGKIGQRSYEVPSYSFILKSCKQDKSAYQSFQLETAYDISELGKLSDRFTSNSRLNFKKTTSILSDLQQLLNNLKNEESENFTRDFQELIRSVQSSQVKNNFMNIMAQVVNSMDESKDKEKVIKIMEIIHSKISNMLETVEKIAEDSEQVDENLLELLGSLPNLIETTVSSQNVLQHMENRLLADVKLLVDDYAQFNVKALNETVGNCGPLHKAFESTVDTVCINVLDPVGGFWFAMSLCLIAFIPYIIAGWIMARQYSLSYKRGGFRKCCICF